MADHDKRGEQPTPTHVGEVSASVGLQRLLTHAGEELQADVEIIDAAPPVAPAPQQDAPPCRMLTVPLPAVGGRTRGHLRITRWPGSAGQAGDDRLVGMVARLISQELAVVDQRREHHIARVERIQTLLESDQLSIVYQPIADLYTGDVVGVEALSRFPRPPDQGPDEWFSQAAGVGLGSRLEAMAVAHAVQALPRLAEHVYLSVNVSPEAAMSRELALVLSDVPLERIVLEITEHAEVHDYDALNLAVRRMRSRGARLAVDDAGSGFASMRHVLRLAPDIIKLDTSLTHGIDNDSMARALGYSLKSFAAAIDAQVVAEGIETEQEVDALRFLGVAFGQGYYLRRPGPLPDDGWVSETTVTFGSPPAGRRSAPTLPSESPPAGRRSAPTLTPTRTA